MSSVVFPEPDGPITATNSPFPTSYGKLDQVEEELKDSFVRIHQRYLVRTQAVQQISGSQVLVGGQTLPISRSCQQAAMIALTRASLEE